MARKKGSNNSKGKSKCMKGAVKDKGTSYYEMVQDALVGLRQWKGSLKKDILKYITSKYGLTETTKQKRALDVALMSGVRKGSLMNIDNRFKLVNIDKEKDDSMKVKKREGTDKVKGILPGASKRKNTAKKQPVKSMSSESNNAKNGEGKGMTKSEQDYEVNIQSQTTDHRLIRSKIYARKCYSPYSRAPGDKKVCQIIAIDVTPDRHRMVLIDSNNKNIKTFDYLIRYRAVYNFESSEHGPKALAVLNNDEVVVSVYSNTLPSTDLIILDIGGKLGKAITDTKIMKTIPTDGQTIRSIACHEGKIYIAGNETTRGENAFLKMIDRDGKPYWSISIDGNRKKACPYNVTCLLNNDSLSVLVTDVNNKRVLKYNGSNGDMLSCYEEGNITGLTAGAGFLFASFSGNKGIYMYGPNMDGKKLVVSGRFYPLCLKYHELNGCRQCRLLVSYYYERKQSCSSYVDIYGLLN